MHWLSENTTVRSCPREPPTTHPRPTHIALNKNRCLQRADLGLRAADACAVGSPGSPGTPSCALVSAYVLHIKNHAIARGVALPRTHHMTNSIHVIIISLHVLVCNGRTGKLASARVHDNPNLVFFSPMGSPNCIRAIKHYKNTILFH